MTMLPQVSIITVCFNSVKTISETLKSVTEQDYSQIEYIIIDGGSTDGTLDVIQSYSDKIHLVISEPDKGIYDAMNKGIAKAKGDIVGLLNADDLYNNNNVISKVASLFVDSNLDACYGDLIYFSDKSPEKVARYWRSSPFVTGLFAKGWCPPHPTLFVRRQLYLKYGAFDTAYAMGNDVELMMRFFEKYRIRSYYLPQILVKMRLGGISNRSFKSIVVQNQCILRAAEKHQIPFSLSTFFGYKIMNRLSQWILKP